MTRLTLTLKDSDTRVGLRCDTPEIREDRELTADALKQLAAWSDTYHDAIGHDPKLATLVKLGREMFAWLDGGARTLRRLRDEATGPLVFEFIADRAPFEDAKTFLDAPWELLADVDGFWAGNANLAYCPVRRLGAPRPPAQPSPFKLPCIFMAAAPRSMDNLNYENEEAAILSASQGTGMELVVEESGTLDLLRKCVAREKPVDVIQISCHGTLQPTPRLVLEDEIGDAKPATAEQLTRDLRGHPPGLLFLSACQTAMADRVLFSLSSRSLGR